MPLKTQSFRFGEFLLDARDKVLLRGRDPVPITPKAFLLLQTLLEDHGHLVEKENLLRTVWPDSFVEEGNLSFTINMLRKALGDSRSEPKYIETVPKAGYRFIADVCETANGSGCEPVSKPLAGTSSSSRFKIFLVATIAIVSSGIGFSGYWISKNEPRDAPVLSAQFASEKLSTNGRVLHAIISPDGKNVVYTNGIEGKQSVWLRQLESSHSVEIIPPSDDFYYGLALSPDGNFLYFARSPRNLREMGIHRVSIFGGVPAKIVSGSEGWMSISPDGTKISFVRCPYTKDEYCSLWVADAKTGENERKLLSRPQPIRIVDNEFSPDGSTVAFAVGQSQNQANEFGLAEVDLESGNERDLTAERFFNIRSLTWLPGRSGLLVTAARIPNKQYRIWEVSLTTGVAQPLTSDSESYSRLSLNKDASLLISTQGKQDFHLSLLNPDAPAVRSVLADASGAAFFPNGKIVFCSIMSGNDEIWSINADGTGLRQLTNDSADDIVPIVSPDGDLIFFASNRTGNSQVWRMNADGSDQVQVTFKEGGRPVFVSSDGKWVYYHHGVDRTLWRVSTKDGNEELVFGKRAIFFAVSPDGRQVAFSERGDKDRIISIASLSDGSVIKTWNVPFRESSGNDIVWMPDGKGLVYVSMEGSENAFMLQPIDGKTPTKIADLGSEEVNSFALAPDGKSFAVVQGGWKYDAVLIRGLK